MSLHTDFFKETRSLIIASASGLFLYSQALPAQTPQKALPEVSVTASRHYEEPKLLPTSGLQVHPLMEVAEGRIMPVQHVQQQPEQQRLNRLYGNQSEEQGIVQPVQVQPVLQTPPTPVRQTAGSRVPRKSLFDRLVGKIKGDSNIPTGPPEDPGMNYTTVTEAQLQKTRAPQLVQQPGALPPVEKFAPPPAPGISELPAPAAIPRVADVQTTGDEPRSFPGAGPAPAQAPEMPAAIIAENAATPKIPDSFIPPLPGSEEAEALADSQPEKQSFPELKAIMEAEVPAPTAESITEPVQVAVTPKPAPTPEIPPIVAEVAPIVPPMPEIESNPVSIAPPPAAVTPPPAPAPQFPVVKAKPKARPLLDLNGPLPLLEDVLAAENADTAAVNEQVAEALELKVAPEAMPLEVPAPEPVIATTELPSASEVSVTPKTPMIEVPAPELAPTDVTAEAVAETEQAPPDTAGLQAPAMAASADVSADPLANPFPADVTTDVETDDLNAELLNSNPLAEVAPEEAPVGQAPAMPSEDELEVEEAPYSGLALEDDLFLKGKIPAPAEPSTMLSPRPATPEVAELDDREMPELPPFPALDVEEKQEEIAASEPAAESEELTPSKEFPQLQSPEPEQKVAMAPLELQPRVQVKPKQNVQLSKMELIAARKNQTGLKGFCPVQLRDTRDLVDVDENYSAIFNNKKYSFSNSEALQRFIADPEKYAPAIHGSDVIHLSLTGEEIEGSLDHAVWFKGRLYLFATAETMETFVAAPSSYYTNQ